jgi:hypothetical protein
MPVKIINEADIDRELHRFATPAHSPSVKQWLKTTVKAHLLNLKGADRDENFRVYVAASVKDLYGEPMPFDKLPDWAKIALERGETLHWFDPIQVQKRETWKTIKRITVWLNSFPLGLAFEDADRQATAWATKVNFRP